MGRTRRGIGLDLISHHEKIEFRGRIARLKLTGRQIGRPSAIASEAGPPQSVL